MRWYLLLALLCGCDQLFGFQQVPTAPIVDAVDAAPPGNWTSVAVGARHTCALATGGHLACWGDAIAGGGSLVPAPVGDPQVVWTQIAAGGHHTCGVAQDRAWCWGGNAAGESTGAAGQPIGAPQVVALPAGTPKVDSVAAGAVHSCALAGGELWCWGNPLQTTGVDSRPVLVAPATKFTQISAGADHSCAIDDQGGVWCWGGDGQGQSSGLPCPTGACSRPQPGMMSLPEKATAIAAGNQATCALLASGTVSCWGSGSIAPSQTPATTLAGSSWTGIALGNDFGCALGNGKASCWGHVVAGGLGDGTWSENLAPTAITNEILADGVALSRSFDGDESACVIASGNISCWGTNLGGQLGSTATMHVTPVRAAGTWQHLYVGDAHVCGQAADHTIGCWGANDVGQVTASTCTQPSCDQLVPVTVALAGMPDEVVAGDDYTCARTGSTITCWGDDTHDQLGPTPQRPHDNTFALINVSDLIGGHEGTCVFAANMTQCWGRIAGSDSALPQTQVPKMTSAGLGDSAACGLDNSGTRYCWGYGYWGQLGDGENASSTSQSMPVFTGMEDMYSKISFAHRSACAIATNGRVRCWGQNFENETRPDTSITGSEPDPEVTLYPELVPGATGSYIQNCSAIATSYTNSCAICANAPLCWGARQNGRTGEGIDATNLTTSAVPVDVPTGHTWSEIGLGNDFGCALASDDNSVWCWGLGIRGQIGDGSHGANTPVPMPAPPM